MKFIRSEKIPPPVGPYSQAVETGNLIFVSGQLGMDEKGVLPESITEQADFILKNMGAFLEDIGLGVENIVKVNIYMTDMGAFADVNSIYAVFMKEHKPARAAVEVAALPKNAKIEMEFILEK